VSGERAIDRVLALAAVPGLVDVHPDDLASLAGRASERRVAPGEPAAEPGTREVLFLLSGALGDGPGRPPIAAPAMVGVVEALADGEEFSPGADAESSLRALADGAHLLAVGREDLRWVIGDIFELWLAMLRHVAQRLLAVEPLEIEVPAARPPPAEAGEVPLASRIHLLAGCELLRGLRVYALGRLAAEMEEFELPARSTLWEPGAPSRDVFVLVDGCIAGPRRPGADASDHGPGAVLGLREALSARPHCSRVEVTRDARVLRLGRGSLIDELEDDPDMATALLEGIAARTLRAEFAAQEPAR
jgi:CRP-like cAMP-binding protein